MHIVKRRMHLALCRALLNKRTLTLLHHSSVAKRGLEHLFMLALFSFSFFVSRTELERTDYILSHMG